MNVLLSGTAGEREHEKETDEGVELLHVAFARAG
jgi:hypothetical protein